MKIYVLEGEPSKIMTPYTYYRRKCDAYVMELEVKQTDTYGVFIRRVIRRP